MKIRNIPFGYRIENGTIHLHPTESQVVREIHAAYLDGQSLLQIAASLNERGGEYMPGAAAWNKARNRCSVRLMDCSMVSVMMRHLSGRFLKMLP